MTSLPKGEFLNREKLNYTYMIVILNVAMMNDASWELEDQARKHCFGQKKKKKNTFAFGL